MRRGWCAAHVISQVQPRTDLSVVAEVIEILRIHAHPELRFEIRPRSAIGEVHGIGDRLRPDRGLQRVGACRPKAVATAGSNVTSRTYS